jgi:hypothetical protein
MAIAASVLCQWRYHANRKSPVQAQSAATSPPQRFPNYSTNSKCNNDQIIHDFRPYWPPVATIDGDDCATRKVTLPRSMELKEIPISSSDEDDVHM